MSGTFTPTTEQVEDGYARDPEYEYHHPTDTGYLAENHRAFRRWLAEHDRQVAERTINEFEDLYFGPWGQTREWVAKTMRERHGLPPRKQEKEAE